MIRWRAKGRALNEQALQWAERALALDPDLAEGYAAKGNVLENLGRWTECKEAYRRSIELDPNFATGHQWYARTYLRKVTLTRRWWK